MQRIHSLLVALALLVPAGCSSAPAVASEFDAAAKRFAPEAGKANLYVVREKVVGSQTKLEIFLDERSLGELAPGTYFMVSVTPGKHTLRAESPGLPPESGPVDTEAGKNYFFTASTLRRVWKTEVIADALSEKAGKKEVLDAERAKTLLGEK